MVIGDIITIRVREAQALYTEYWLQKLGIPYEGGLSPEIVAEHKTSKSKNHALSKEKVAAATNVGTVDFIDHISNFVERIVSILPVESD